MTSSYDSFFQARPKIHPCSHGCPLLDIPTYIAGTFEDVCFAIPLLRGTRTACEIWMASLWARQNKQTKKVLPKTLLPITTIFSSSLWPFQNQDKDYFKWGVQNYKHQLVVLVASFGQNFYLKEVISFCAFQMKKMPSLHFPQALLYLPSVALDSCWQQ